MGGFITGICTTIILMQVPKIMGGTSGTGELPELVEHIIDTGKDINMPSIYIGIVALIILLVSKKIMSKFPMAVVLMVIGVIMTKFMPLQQWGVKTLDSVAPGLPSWKVPDFGAYTMTDLVMICLLYTSRCV